MYWPVWIVHAFSLPVRHCTGLCCILCYARVAEGYISWLAAFLQALCVNQHSFLYSTLCRLLKRRYNLNIQVTCYNAATNQQHYYHSFNEIRVWLTLQCSGLKNRSLLQHPQNPVNKRPTVLWIQKMLKVFIFILSFQIKLQVPNRKHNRGEHLLARIQHSEAPVCAAGQGPAV